MPSDLLIFRIAVGAGQDRHRHHDLGLLAERRLDVATEEQVEALLGPTELDVGVDRDRVVALQDRVEQLEQGDRLGGRHPVAEVVALEQPRDVKRRASPNSSALGMSSHSLLNLTSVRSASRILKAWSWNVRALSAISSAESIGRSAERPLGSPTRAV